MSSICFPRSSIFSFPPYSMGPIWTESMSFLDIWYHLEFGPGDGRTAREGVWSVCLVVFWCHQSGVWWEYLRIVFVLTFIDLSKNNGLGNLISVFRRTDLFLWTTRSFKAFCLFVVCYFCHCCCWFFLIKRITPL